MRKRFLCTLLAAVLLLGLIPNTAVHMPALATQQTANFKTSDDMVEVLKKMEGFLPKPVWDVSQWSVGYGTRCPADKLEEYKANGISKEEAEALMRDFLTSFEKAVNNFANKYSVSLNQHQFDALVSFTYNCGTGWLSNENSYIHEAVRSGDVSNKIIYAFMLWTKNIPHVANRRLCELNIYINGIYKAYNVSSSQRYHKDYKFVYLDANGGQLDYDIYGYDAANPAPISATFTNIPTGVDAGGNVFAYEFAGWFTAPEGGTQVTILDHNFKNDVNNSGSGLAYSAKLYAQWRDPNTGAVGKPAEPEKPEDPEPKPEYQTGTVTGNDVNVRSDTTTNADNIVEKKNKGDAVTVYETKEANGYKWAKIGENKWIVMDYVKINDSSDPGNGSTPAEPNSKVVSLEILKLPDKLEYCTREVLDLSGSLLKAVFEDGTVRYMSIYRDLIVQFYNNTLGKKALTVLYKGVTASFDVTIKGKVEFRNYDGTLLQSGVYAKGEAVQPPADPERPKDEINTYVFAGWDKAVTPCEANAVYTAVFTPVPIDRPCTSIAIAQMPAKTVYKQGTEALDLTGAKLTANYTDGTTAVVDITQRMVSGFDNTVPGTNTVTVTYGGVNTTFQVTITNYVVTFLNYDGSVLSQNQYAIGEKVTAPADPARPQDDKGVYVFTGWDKEVVPCAGEATYMATFALHHTITFVNYDGKVLSQTVYAPGAAVSAPADPERSADAIGEYVFAGWDKEVTACAGNATYTATFKLRYALGDLDCSGKVDENDAIHLLRHVLFPEKYTIRAWADYDGDGKVGESDAIYLLRHVLFPEKYPLKTP